MKYLKLAATAAALSLGAFATQASADTYMLNLTDSQSAFSSPYAKVDVTSPVSGELDFTLTYLNPPGFHGVDTGSHNLFTFSLTGEGALTLTPQTGLSLTTNIDGVNNGGFHGFDYAIACTLAACAPNNGGLPGPVSFVVTGAGIGLASLSNEATFGTTNVLFAADTLSFGPNGTTGAIGGGSTDTIILHGVPETATWGMMIMGFGMVGAGLRLRRRKPALAA